MAQRGYDQRVRFLSGEHPIRNFAAVNQIRTLVKFFLRTPDSGVRLLLTKFTLLPLEEIEEIWVKHEVRSTQCISQCTFSPYITYSQSQNCASPSELSPQKSPSSFMEVSSSLCTPPPFLRIYSAIERGLQRALAATNALFETDVSAICAEDVIQALGHDPRLRFARAEELIGQQLTKLAPVHSLTRSRGKFIAFFQVLVQY
jgi:hypothetical protein